MADEADPTKSDTLNRRDFLAKVGTAAIAGSLTMINPLWAAGESTPKDRPVYRAPESYHWRQARTGHYHQWLYSGSSYSDDRGKRGTDPGA